MKTAQQILESIRAREAGKKAAQEGLKLGANTYPEDSELHWDWLDAWCVEKAKLRSQNSDYPHQK